MEAPHDLKPPNTMPTLTLSSQEIKEEIHKNPQLILDLSLCRNDHLNPKLDLIEGFKAEYPRDSSKTPVGNEEEPRVYSCNYCQRKFYSSQALGGHQNAHKRERTLVKRANRMNSTSLYASIPLYGSYNFTHKPLGVQAHSLIHKPSISYLAFSGVSSSHRGWSKTPLIDQQSTGIGRLGASSFPSSTSSSPSNGGAARFGSFKKVSQPLDKNVEGVCWKGSVLKISTHKQDYDQLNKLDLSLKL